MSQMTDLAYDIEQLYIEGHSPKVISLMLECSIDTIYEWIEAVGVDAVDEDELYQRT